MSDPDLDHRHAVALFRYGLIAELARLEPGADGLYRQIAEKARADYTIPGTTRTRVAAETIRHWLKRYRAGGFDALLPKPRADRGRPRKLPDDIAEQLVAIKEAHPKLSVRAVIQHARAAGHLPPDLDVAPSTVHRLLAREGLMRKRPDAPSTLDRRRFAFARAGELWMSDVMHGPAVTVDGRTKRKTYLIAFLDDATRVIPFAAFALAESTAAFLPVFKQALLRRGCPERLYVDNGANFRSHHLSLVCAKLGVALIHARPYQPQGKGKLERWFRTCRAQLVSQLRPDDTARLEALNRRLWAFVEGEYHHAPHRGLDGDTPLERWARSADDVRFPEPDLDLDELFLFETTRRVHDCMDAGGRAKQELEPRKTVPSPSTASSTRSTPRSSARRSPSATTPPPRPGVPSKSGTRTGASTTPNPSMPTPTASSSDTARRGTSSPICPRPSPRARWPFAICTAAAMIPTRSKADVPPSLRADPLPLPRPPRDRRAL